MKSKIFLVLILFSCLVFKLGYAKTQKILMIIAHKDFRDEELFVPKKIFEKAGYKVVIASSTLKTCEGMLHHKVKPDKLITQVKVKNYVAVVLVGGIGSVEYFNSPIVHRIVRRAYELHKVIGAICLAPCILAKAGILKGKVATIWYSAATCLEENGATFQKKPVVVDGRIVTAAGPFAAREFALEILRLLGK